MHERHTNDMKSFFRDRKLLPPRTDGHFSCISYISRGHPKKSANLLIYFGNLNVTIGINANVHIIRAASGLNEHQSNEQ
jgi:hypothetical protein